MLALVFSQVLILMFTCGIANPVDEAEAEGKTNMSLSVPLLNKTLPIDLKKSKITVISEGGAIVSNTPALSLSNIDQATPSKVKARKGAFLNAAEDSESSDDIHSNIKFNNATIDDNQHNNNYSVANVSQSTTSSIKSSLSISQPNSTKVHKPTLLSAEAIAKTDEMNTDPAVDNEDDWNVKIHKINSNGHPGMVMPIVITILVVPMFAVIGYMVLKRGQEAWKNRHYKRMDFLLDGMYND